MHIRELIASVNHFFRILALSNVAYGSNYGYEQEVESNLKSEYRTAPQGHRIHAGSYPAEP